MPSGLWTLAYHCGAYSISDTQITEFKLKEAGMVSENEITQKHFEKQLPDHHQLRLLGNQTRLFNCWMFYAIQMVQLFPYRRYYERSIPQCTGTEYKRWLLLLFQPSVTVNYSTVFCYCGNAMLVVWVLLCATSHAWIKWMYLCVFVLLTRLEV